MSQRGVNKVILVGNLGNDPEIRHMPNGDAVANFSIATSEVWKDKNTGEQQERTEWTRCVAFRRQAEIVEQYVKKGSRLYVEGRLQTRSWDQDGVKRYATEIVVNEFQMLDGRNSQQAPASGQSSQAPAAPAQSGQTPPANFDNFDDDIPFN